MLTMQRRGLAACERGPTAGDDLAGGFGCLAQTCALRRAAAHSFTSFCINLEAARQPQDYLLADFGRQGMEQRQRLDSRGGAVR